MAALSMIEVRDDTPSKLPGLPGFEQENLQPWLVQVVASMAALSVVAVLLRVVSRHIRQQALWWDDKMIIFSLLWNLVVIVFIFAMYSAGMGIHMDKLEIENAVHMAKWLLVAEVLYAWNLGWTKLSVLLMYYRIFRVPYFKKMAWAVGGFVMVWVLTITFLFVFICVPVQKLWYPDVPGRCINQVATWIANAASTIFTDLAILLMPIPQVWKLHLRTGEKMGLTFAFGLGFFVVFASAYRTSVLFTYTNTDPTFTLAPTVGWTEIEMSAGIVSACLPTLLPVLRYCLRSLGFNRSLLSPKHGSSSGANASTGTKSAASAPQQSTTSPPPPGANGSAFYRLEDTESDPSVSLEAREGKLRPDDTGRMHSVATYRLQNAHKGSEDIPLSGIHVRTEFEQSTIRR